MTCLKEFKLLVSEVNPKGSPVKYNKYEVYNALLHLSEELREECIDNINEEYGYELVDRYDFARYEISINNSNQEIEMHSLFKPDISKDESEYLRQQMKELQKGYMKLLAN